MISNYRRIVENFSYLSALEVFKLVFPFITLPYLIHILGKENYGLVAFAQAFASYFTILINWGLDISAVKDISVHRDNREKVNEIASSVMLIKLILFLFSILLIGILVFTFTFFQTHLLLYFASLGYCLFEVVFPVWYYQGVEKMKYITIVRFSVTLVYTLLIFTFIRQAGDYLLVPLFNGIGGFIGGLISFFILCRYEGLHLFIPRFIIIRRYFTESIPFFISRISVVINSTLAKIVSGIFLGMEQVAVYDLADKLVNAAKIPLSTVTATVYPYIAKSGDLSFVKKMFYISLMCGACLTAFVAFFATPLVSFFSSGTMLDTVPILRGLSLNILLCSITYYIGVPVLVSFGYASDFNRSVVYSTIFTICAYGFFYLLGHFSLYTFVVITVISELFIAVYRMFYCFKYKLLMQKKTNNE